MTPKRKKVLLRVSGALLTLFTVLVTYSAFARMGGAGGHSSGGHSSGGGGFGGGGYGGGGFVTSPLALVIIAIVVIVYLIFKKQINSAGGGDNAVIPPVAAMPFPAGLDESKVGTAFMAMQDAWMHKDMKQVRKWLSDGMYQRLNTQFKMMKALDQTNTLSNIRVFRVAAAGAATDGNYQTAEIAISFAMDDSFTSARYPEFNESYQGDSDTEFWTFIKRTDSESEKNLYDNNNCPNCGAVFEVKMGEISRCSNCNTLTNSAAYDWVLSEITQQADFSGGAGFRSDAGLKELMANDPFFAVQRMEDIASNIFMQVMEALTIGDKKRLTRFADDVTTDAIMQLKQSTKPFIFDRLFLNGVSMSSYYVADDMVKISFSMSATFRRVTTDGKLRLVDNDFVTQQYSLELSRNKNVLKDSKVGETVYSYECSSCGAPFTDTTEDVCNYCGAPVIDKSKNWVLTGFR